MENNKSLPPALSLLSSERPRNLSWFGAAGLLFGDWGTSRLYVLGLAFLVAGRTSFWLIAAMSLLILAVGWAYTQICRIYPDGGGVYTAARQKARAARRHRRVVALCRLHGHGFIERGRGVSLFRAGRASDGAGPIGRCRRRDHLFQRRGRVRPSRCGDSIAPVCGRSSRSFSSGRSTCWARSTRPREPSLRRRG